MVFREFLVVGLCLVVFVLVRHCLVFGTAGQCNIHPLDCLLLYIGSFVLGFHIQLPLDIIIHDFE